MRALKERIIMQNNTTAGVDYSGLLARTSTALNLSFSAIREKYSNYPLCLMDYIEKGVEEKLIEIRFDREETTLTCTFDSEEVCDCVFLFTDKDEITEQFIRFLKESYDYDFIGNRWILPDDFVKIKKISRPPDDICFIVYHR